MAQVFNAAGIMICDEFLVNTTTQGNQFYSKITGLTNGGFAATWIDGGAQGSDHSIKAQMFDAVGTKIGDEFLVNTTTQGDQFYPTITGLTAGGFVVTWQDDSHQGGDSSGYS